MLNKLSLVAICEMLSGVEKGSSDLNPFTICHSINLKLHQSYIHNIKL